FSAGSDVAFADFEKEIVKQVLNENRNKYSKEYPDFFIPLGLSFYSGIKYFVFNPVELKIAVSSDNGYITLLDIGSLEIKIIKKDVDLLQFSPDGNILIAKVKDKNKIYTYDATTGDKLKKLEFFNFK